MSSTYQEEMKLNLLDEEEIQDNDDDKDTEEQDDFTDSLLISSIFDDLL